MQPALAAPDAGAIPHQNFDTGAAIAKHVGCTVARGARKRLLYARGEAVYADAHVDWFDR
jgi:hypothetical protein